MDLSLSVNLVKKPKIGVLFEKRYSKSRVGSQVETESINPSSSRKVVMIGKGHISMRYIKVPVLMEMGVSLIGLENF